MSDSQTSQDRKGVLQPLFSVILGAAALGFTWYKFSDIVNSSEVQWHEWVRPAFTLLIGILCLAATVLLLARKPSGKEIFKWGLYMVPIMIIANLLVLAIKIIQEAA